MEVGRASSGWMLLILIGMHITYMSASSIYPPASEEKEITANEVIGHAQVGATQFNSIQFNSKIFI